MLQTGGIIQKPWNVIRDRLRHEVCIFGNYTTVINRGSAFPHEIIRTTEGASARRYAFLRDNQKYMQSIRNNEKQSSGLFPNE